MSVPYIGTGFIFLVPSIIDDLLFTFRKEAKVRIHPSCEMLLKQSRKISAAENVRAIKQNAHEWFVYDEMTMNGRIAMVKCVTPVPSLSVAMFGGPLTTPDTLKFGTRDPIGDQTDGGQIMQVEFSDWLCFESDFARLGSLLELRHKWFAYFIYMLQNPGKIVRKVSMDFFFVASWQLSFGRYNAPKFERFC